LAKRGELFFGESDADHAGARFKDGHGMKRPATNSV
jgi:hypothetical protein